MGAKGLITSEKSEGCETLGLVCVWEKKRPVSGGPAEPFSRIWWLKEKAQPGDPRDEGGLSNQPLISGERCLWIRVAGRGAQCDRKGGSSPLLGFFRVEGASARP